MNTDHQRSYEFEPIVIGGGLDEFAREDKLPRSAFEIEDVRHGPAAALRGFESEVPVAAVTAVSPGSSAAVRSAGRRCRLALSSAASMIAVAASVMVAWMVAQVLAARLHWAGVSALRDRRSTVAAFAVALLAVVLAPPWNPPAVSPAAAVSISTSPQASIPTVGVPGASKSDPLPAAPLVGRITAVAPLERPIVPAAVTTAARPAGPELQELVLPAVADHDPPGTTAAEPIPVPVAVVSAVLEAPNPAAAEPAASVPSAVGPVPGSVTADRLAIDDVLAAYRRSYNSLDAGAVSAIWRGVNTRALARAFSSLSHQRLTFEQCDVRVTAADRARARCDGILNYVQKAGDTTPQQRRVSWSMDLSRPDDRWVIVGVQAR